MITLFLLAACEQSSFDSGREEAADTAPSASAHLCASDDGCASSETCDAGMCVPDRCAFAEARDSEPPLGTHLVVEERDDILASSPAAAAATYTERGGEAWRETAAEDIVDVAAIRLPGADTAVGVIATAHAVTIPAAQAWLDLPIEATPIAAIATGDIDGDNADELVILAADGRYDVCKPLAGSCRRGELGGAEALDVAVADLGGEVADSAVFLLRDGGDSVLVVASARPGGEVEVVARERFDERFERVAAGDVTGDGVAEVIALEDGGWLGMAGDRAHVFAPQRDFESPLPAAELPGSSRDLAAGSLFGQGADQLIVLDGGGRYLALSAKDGAWREEAAGELPLSGARRIAVGDLAGRSTTAELTSGPEMRAGRIAPTAVAVFPPYSRAASGGDAPSIRLGHTESRSESLSDSVRLRVQAEVRASFDLAGVVGGGAGVRVQRRLSRTRTSRSALAVGGRYSIRPIDGADPGDGAVALAWGCFHDYRYELPGQGEIVASVPVGGAETVWTTSRYNALAERDADLPSIPMPYEVGNPESYPREPRRLDGSPLAPEDQLFDDIPTYLVSDAAWVSWYLSADERRTRGETRSTGAFTSVGATAGIGVSVGAGVDLAQGYRITTGESVQFGGQVPPIQSDPDTPDDDYLASAYSFRPVVYRERYELRSGDEAGYYALTFAVGLD